MQYIGRLAFVVAALLVALGFAASPPTEAQQKPNLVILMTDDTGWGDFGAYSGGGATLGHPTPGSH